MKIGRCKNIITQLILTVLMLIVGYFVISLIVWMLPTMDSWNLLSKILYGFYCIIIIIGIDG